MVFKAVYFIVNIDLKCLLEFIMHKNSCKFEYFIQ